MNRPEDTAEGPERAARDLRRIRSFVRREGRMTGGQKAAMDRLWPRYGLERPQGRLDLKQVFGRSNAVVFEIGFGNGDHLLSRAISEPQRDFIGAEVHRPGVGHLMLGAEKAGLNNIRAVQDDAVEVLRDWLPEASLAEVIVYFPDPWHKTRHHKRRLIQPEFAALLASRVAPGGRLLLATDWAHYAEHMLAVLNAAPDWRNESPDNGYVPRHATRPKTKFEARGERLGHEVFDLSYIRR